MGTSASFTLFKAPSSSRIKKPTRKIQPKPPSLHSGPVFGVSLAVLRETGQLVRGIPWVLRDMVEFLDRHALHQKGLFRLSGSVVKTSLLKVRCDRGEALDLSAGEDFQNVASLLKLFLREIPLAVIPCLQRTGMVRCFRECSDERVMNHTLKEKLNSLPEDNHNVLSYLCHFLLKVASHSHLNHMSVENLATIFGPCLFHVPYGPNMLEEQSQCNAVVCHLLKNHSYLMSGDLDTPSPPPALLALSAREETAIVHVPSFWPHACESTVETQLPDTETQVLKTVETQLPDTAETQVLYTVETQLPGTVETQMQDTVETQLPGTAEAQVLYTVETQLPDTAETQVLYTVETQLPGTVETQLPGTPETRLLGTIETQLPGTVETQLPGTAETQVLYTVETQLPGTAETRLLGTVETQLPGTVETQLPGTAETRLLGTVETQLPGTVETQLPGTAETQVLYTVETQLPGTAETQLPGTAETQFPGTAETQFPGTVETQLPGTAETQFPGTVETQVQDTAHLALTSFQLPRDEANRLKLSAGFLSGGYDSVAPADATPEIESAAPQNRERPGQDRTLRPQRPTSGSRHFSGQQKGFCQDTVFTADLTDVRGNAGAAANRDLRTPGSPHTDRVEHILTEDNQMPQACDKGSLLKLQAVEEEACPSAVNRREDAGQTASPTPAPPETGRDPVSRAPGPDGESCEGQGAPGPSRLLLHIADCTSPLPSPRCASLSQSQRFHSDPEAAPSPPCSQPFIKARPIARTQFPEGSADTLSITMLTKHIQTLKRKIRRFEEQFEQERNYRPSHNDKTVNPEVLQLMSDLAKSRKQLRDLRLKQSVEQMRAQKMEEHTDMCRYGGDLQGAPEQSHKPSLEDTLEALLKRLKDKRQALGLPDNMKEMTQKQMALEKITLQKCLLYFESLHGRPGTRQERTLMKPLYDRYRTIKQLLCAVSTITTIAEEDSSDDDCTQRSSLPSCRAIRLQCLDDSACPQEEDSDATFVSPLDEVKAVRQPAGTVSNLHEASRSELLQCLRETRLEKKKLRKGLREFEEQFYRQMGRSAQKDDRIPMAEEYQEYKNLKAKLRLLEALLSKQETPKII